MTTFKAKDTVSYHGAHYPEHRGKTGTVLYLVAETMAVVDFAPDPVPRRIGTRFLRLIERAPEPALDTVGTVPLSPVEMAFREGFRLGSQGGQSVERAWAESRAQAAPPASAETLQSFVNRLAEGITHLKCSEAKKETIKAGVLAVLRGMGARETPDEAHAAYEDATHAAADERMSHARRLAAHYRTGGDD